jgi:hypothetical protein
MGRWELLLAAIGEPGERGKHASREDVIGAAIIFGLLFAGLAVATIRDRLRRRFAKRNAKRS